MTILYLRHAAVHATDLLIRLVHAMLMTFFFIMPAVISGFGNLLLPVMLMLVMVTIVAHQLMS